MQTTLNPYLTGRFEFGGQEVQCAAPDGVQVKAYLAVPRGSGTHPGVIVLHENKGLLPYLRDVSDGLASEGFVALAPDLLTREGGTEHFADPINDIAPVLATIPRERHVADVEAAIAYLKQRGDVGKVGVIGFCFGGGITWLFGASGGRGADALMPFYGANPPLDAVSNIRLPVLAVYGELDARVNAGLPALREALAANPNVPIEIEIYPSSKHSFHNHHHHLGNYNPDTARQAWQAAVEFLRKHLEGGPAGAARSS